MEGSGAGEVVVVIGYESLLEAVVVIRELMLTRVVRHSRNL